MENQTKVEIVQALKSAKTNVEQRRETMLTALKDLGETFALVLDSIENVPPGLGIVSRGETIVVGPVEEGNTVSTPVASGTVHWVEDDDGNGEIEFMLKMTNQIEASAFKDLPSIATALAEPLIEDLYKLEDQRLLIQAMVPGQSQEDGPPVQPSAPPDDAAKVRWKWKCTRLGETIDGTLMALNETEARDTLAKLGYEVLELERDHEAHQ
jgi:hypothetical protein